MLDSHNAPPSNGAGNREQVSGFHIEYYVFLQKWVVIFRKLSNRDIPLLLAGLFTGEMMKTFPKYKATYWNCDDDCNCWQPVIQEFLHMYGKFPVYKFVEAGEFVSEPTIDEFLEMEAWMKTACEKYGIDVLRLGFSFLPEDR